MDWGYVAGYFDGEGNVSMRKSGRVNAALCWTNTHRASLEAMREFIGCGIVRGRKRPNNPRHSQQFALYVARHDDLRRVLPELMARCIIKRPALEAMFSRIEHAPGVSKSHGNLAAAGADTVRRLYWDDDLTQREIGQRYGVTQTAVKNYMRRHNIPRRSRQECMRPLSPERAALRRQKLSDGMRKRWQDDESRQRMMDGIISAQPKRLATRRTRRDTSVLRAS